LIVFLLVAVTLGLILEGVKATGERAAKNDARTSEDRTAGQLEIDPAEHLVFVDGNETDLTATEFKLLAFFAANAGRLLKHDAILANVWGDGYADDTRILRTYVKQVRAKLGDDP